MLCELVFQDSCEKMVSTTHKTLTRFKMVIIGLVCDLLVAKRTLCCEKWFKRYLSAKFQKTNSKILQKTCFFQKDAFPLSKLEKRWSWKFSWVTNPTESKMTLSYSFLSCLFSSKNEKLTFFFRFLSYLEKIRSYIDIWQKKIGEVRKVF